MIQVRKAVAADLPVVWKFLLKKAEFDNWLDRLEATPELLENALFGEEPQAGAYLAEIDGKPVGFATYFYSFSTYLARRGIWLDDLFVDPTERGRGVGKALLKTLAEHALEQGYGRIEWVTASKNDRALDFYRGLGATVRHGALVCRLERLSLADVAQGLET